MRAPLPEEFDWIFSRVPRLTVELVIASADRGVLLQLRDVGPCSGMWGLAGGTVRIGEPLMQAAQRVARDELAIAVRVGELLGYIEYPSHYLNGLDSPVGLAFRTGIRGAEPPRNCKWWCVLPDNMHEEQKSFLAKHAVAAPSEASDSAAAGPR